MSHLPWKGFYTGTCPAQTVCGARICADRGFPGTSSRTPAPTAILWAILPPTIPRALTYYGGYQPPYLQPPMPDQLAQLRQQQYQPMQASPQPAPLPQQGQPGIVWVPNETAAHEYLVAPNNAVALWDSNSPTIYLKQADASGKPSMKIYDLVERNAAKSPVPVPQAPEVEYATKEELNALAARLDAMASKETPKPAKKPAKEEAENG